MDHLLGGLPEEYKSMVMGIENSVKSVSADSIKTTLLQEVQFESRNNEIALMGKNKHKNQNQRNSVAMTVAILVILQENVLKRESSQVKVIMCDSHRF